MQGQRRYEHYSITEGENKFSPKAAYVVIGLAFGSAVAAMWIDGLDRDNGEADWNRPLTNEPEITIMATPVPAETATLVTSDGTEFYIDDDIDADIGE
jgi:hypothetical protein